VPTPLVRVETIAPPAVNVGQPLTYQIVVRNIGTVPVYAVEVEDRLPNGARFRSAEPNAEVQGDRLSWNLGDLAVGGELRIRVEVEATTEGELRSSARIRYSATSDHSTRITRGRLTVTKTGPESVPVGDAVPFQIQVTNTGTGPATNVLIRDILPPGLQHPQGRQIEADLGTLEAGQTKTFPLQATAAEPGRQVNEVIVTADGGLQATAQAVVIVTQPVLTFRKTGPALRFLGREVEFDLEIQNTGTAPAAGVRIVDDVPESMEFASASDGGVYDPAMRQVQWALGSLAPGQRRGLTVKLTAQKAGEWTNRAMAQGDRVPPVPAEATVLLQGVPALMLEVVDLDDPVEVDAETSYEIRIVNQGTCATTNLRILATLPAGMVFRGAVGPTNYHLAGTEIVFDALPKLAARADAIYRVKVCGAKPGDWRFGVRMMSDQLRAPVYEEESTRVYDDREQ
jgi:uncharacterized repeat protein (TIGR01451 family)